MRRKITIYLLALFIFLSSGTVLATYFIKKTTVEFSRIIKLHQIEDLRQNLVMSIQTTQSDLYTFRTELVHEPDSVKLESIMDNITALESAAGGCTFCHHPPELARRLEEIQSLINEYKSAFSYYITASVDMEMTQELRHNAADIGLELFVKAEEMSSEAGKHLEVITSSATTGMERAGSTLYITIAFTFILGVIVSVRLAMSVTKPAEKLVSATRAIASGDLGHTVSYRDRTEMGEIASHFNEMSINLKEGHEELIREITMRKQIEGELKESHQQLRDLSMYLLDVREEERTNVAREIHDELGQRLTALKMDVSWLSKKVPQDPESVVIKIQQIIMSINTTINTVKNISSKLRPSLLDHFGLTAAIEWQAKEFENITDITCDVMIEPEDIRLDKDLSTTVFRIFQETLTNIVRHAKATSVRMSLKEEEDRIVFEIIDNGKGISSEKVTSPKSFGLVGIKERVKAVGGEVCIWGIPEQGTTVTITIPLNNRERADNG
jgi:signal transduction histidine kinase